MNLKLKEKIKESLSAVLPITGIVLMLSIFLVPMELGSIVMFLTGAVMLIVGMGFFQLGAEMAMTPIGEGVGVQISKMKKLITVLLTGFVMGVIITVSEPDLQVLAGQVPSVPNAVLIMTVAIGVGLFLALAIVRIRYKISLPLLLIICYAALILISLFVPKEFLAVAFDSGGVTTGPMTVPFIMAMGVGLASVRSDKNAASDSFGLVALSSVGPILAVLILGCFYKPTEAAYTLTDVATVVTTQDVARVFAQGLPLYAKEVLVSLLPIIAVFLISNDDPPLPKAADQAHCRWLCVYIHRSGAVPLRSQCRLCTARLLSRQRADRGVLPLDFDPHRYADRLLYRKGRTCHPSAEPSGRDCYKRRYLRKNDEPLHVDRCSRERGAGNASCSYRDLYSMVCDPRIPHRSGAVPFCSGYFYRYCI